MKILITGIAGFIGAHVAKKLKERGDTIIGIDNFNDYYDPQLKKDRLKALLGANLPQIYRSDIRDEKELSKIFKKEKPQKVIHLAAMAGVRGSMKDPLLYNEVNVIGTINLLNQSVQAKVANFVYASSSSVYGNSKRIPYKEDDQTIRPISIYAATKLSNEITAYVYSHNYGLNTTGLRYFTVYGPWGRPDMAYYKFSSKLIKGEPLPIYNRGKMLRDFTYIDDVSEATIKALDTPRKFRVLNVGGGSVEKLTKLISCLEQGLGKKAQQKLLPLQAGDVVMTQADISLLKSLGWKPQTKLTQGIKKFSIWFKEYYKSKKRK